MDDYQTDTGGINSLSGFAYQIRVFVLYMLTMEKDMQTEFETLEDVALNNLSPNTIVQTRINLRVVLDHLLE